MADKSWISYQGARVRAAMKRSRSNWIRTKAWDWEFKHGKWDYIAEHEHDASYDAVIAHLKGGRLLDLGCGSGGTRCYLAPHLSSYVGLDYSAEAIGQLEQRTAGLPPLTHGQQFLVGDMTDRELLQRSGGDFDIVLLHECINYVEAPRVPDFLRDLCHLLKPGGVVIIRIWERNRYADHVAAIRSALHIIEETQSETSTSIFIVADGPLP